MNRLLDAGWHRLIHSMLFRVATLGFAIFGVVLRGLIYWNLTRFGESTANCNVDDGMYAYAMFLGITMAVFVAWFTGTQYSEGTLRNKISIGHKRWQIYLSEVIVCSVAGIVFAAGFSIPYVGLGLLAGFHNTITVENLVSQSLAVVLLIVAFTAFYVTITFLIMNRTAAAVVTLLLAFMGFFVTVFLNSALREEEYRVMVVVDEQGETQRIEKPNSYYISGTKRVVYQTVFDAVPPCQAFQLADAYSDCCVIPQFYAYSLAEIVLFGAIGIGMFRRRDLK